MNSSLKIREDRNRIRRNRNRRYCRLRRISWNCMVIWHHQYIKWDLVCLQDTIQTYIVNYDYNIMYHYTYQSDPVIYSIYQNELTNTIAIRNIMNFYHLYLAILNSSTITSIVDMYRNVPTEIARNIPVTIGPSDANAHPTAIPIGFITA